MSGGADNVPEGTAEPCYLAGQAPSHTLLSPFLVVTQEVLPSILPPSLYCHLKVTYVHIFCECFNS